MAALLLCSALAAADECAARPEVDHELLERMRSVSAANQQRSRPFVLAVGRGTTATHAVAAALEQAGRYVIHGANSEHRDRANTAIEHFKHKEDFSSHLYCSVA